MCKSSEGRENKIKIREWVKFGQTERKEEEEYKEDGSTFSYLKCLTFSNEQ